MTILSEFVSLHNTELLIVYLFILYMVFSISV